MLSVSASAPPTKKSRMPFHGAATKSTLIYFPKKVLWTVLSHYFFHVSFIIKQKTMDLFRAARHRKLFFHVNVIFV